MRVYLLVGRISSVITSYSIHYTKLYETLAPVAASIVADVSAGVRFADRAMRSWARAMSSKSTSSGPCPVCVLITAVITSYSIHYTKLYDPGIGATLTRRAFVEASHVLVSSMGSGHRVIEEALEKHGISRRIALRVPHFTVLPTVLERTDRNNFV